MKLSEFPTTVDGKLLFEYDVPDPVLAMASLFNRDGATSVIPSTGSSLRREQKTSLTLPAILVKDSAEYGGRPATCAHFKPCDECWPWPTRTYAELVVVDGSVLALYPMAVISSDRLLIPLVAMTGPSRETIRGRPAGPIHTSPGRSRVGRAAVQLPKAGLHVIAAVRPLACRRRGARLPRH